MASAVENKIFGLISGVVGDSGYELVRVRVMGGGKHAVLQIMAERKDGAGMTVEDCASISRMVSDIIEVDPALTDRYGLEVSSPGIDRPLVKLQDYVRFRGHVAKVDLLSPVAGVKRFQGSIAGVSGDAVEFVTDKGAISVSFDAIGDAKLVLTDDLLKAAAGVKADCRS